MVEPGDIAHLMAFLADRMKLAMDREVPEYPTVRAALVGELVVNPSLTLEESLRHERREPNQVG